MCLYCTYIVPAAREKGFFYFSLAEINYIDLMMLEKERGEKPEAVFLEHLYIHS